MKNAFSVISGVLAITSSIPYIADIARNKTHPNLVTWVTWTVVSAINTAAAISDGEIRTAFLSGVVALTNLGIVIMGTKRGVKKYTLFDLVCQGLAIFGLALWLATGDPSLAVLLSLTVILIAALPTWRHAWIAPFEETWQGFAMACVAGLLTLMSLSDYTFVSLAYPLSLIANTTIMVSIILSRRRAIYALARVS